MVEASIPLLPLKRRVVLVLWHGPGGGGEKRGCAREMDKEKATREAAADALQLALVPLPLFSRPVLTLIYGRGRSLIKVRR